MGFIFQQMYMLKNLTVLDNIILPAVQSKKTTGTRKETMQRGRELMRKLGITDIADNDINEVSGGQLQRACICRSMINKPKMIFAEEPTVAARCTRVLYIVDGNIKGEYNLNRCENAAQIRERERLLNNWLLELGW